MPTLRSASAENLATRLRQARQTARTQRAGVEGTARELILVAFGMPVLVLAVLLVGLLTLLLMSGGALSPIAVTVATCWLAIHLVPVTISGVTIGVLPLLPTLLIAAGTAATASSAARPGRPAATLSAAVCAILGGPILITAVALAVVMDGSSDMQVQSPDALVAFGTTFAVHAIATACGMGWRRRRDLNARWSITSADRRGLRYGVVAVVGLLTAAAILVVVRLIMRFHVVGELMSSGYRFDGYLGLTGLSVLYLPNLVVGAAVVLVGADVHFGLMSIGVMSVHPGPVPPLPLLAVLPSGGIGRWGLLGLVIPVALAVFVGWRCRSAGFVAHLRAAGVAAGVAATIMVVLGCGLGGALGEFGAVGVNVAAVGVFTFGWFAALGLLVALVYRCLPSTRRAGLAPDDELDSWLDDDLGYDDEYVADVDGLVGAAGAQEPTVSDGTEWGPEYFNDIPGDDAKGEVGVDADDEQSETQELIDRDAMEPVSATRSTAANGDHLGSQV
ncbi:MAG: DUF6350 family protein [Gordonia sp. (in: high G+C Gram-positive bacteria)]